MKQIIIILLISLAGLSSAYSQQCCKSSKRNAQRTSIEINANATGYQLMFDFEKGRKHNHPTFAIWIEDMEGNYIQDIFVTRSFATGTFRFGAQSDGKWVAGERRYQASLPYYLYRRASALKLADMVPSQKSPVADAYTGATPDASFSLNARSDNTSLKKFRILIEVNQPWDVNDYWYSGKYPDDRDYKASCQPSLIYAVTIDSDEIMESYVFNPIGHGHYSGLDGKLYTDLSTMTTALQIFERITVRVSKN